MVAESGVSEAFAYNALDADLIRHVLGRIGATWWEVLWSTTDRKVNTAGNFKCGDWVRNLKLSSASPGLHGCGAALSFGQIRLPWLSIYPHNWYGWSRGEACAAWQIEGSRRKAVVGND